MVMRFLLLNNPKRTDNSNMNTPVNIPLVSFKVPVGSIFLALFSQEKMIPRYMEIRA